MVKLTTFQQALEYVNRLGFAGGGNISDKQYNLCQVVDAIERKVSAFQPDPYPCEVEFNRPVDYGQYGVSLWDGTFQIKDAQGRRYSLWCGDLRA